MFNGQVYGAGYLEGILTNEQIYHLWQNVWDGFTDNWPNALHNSIKDYLNQNDQWVRSQWEGADQYSGYWARYWHQVKLAYLQAQGIRDAYNALVEDGQAESIPQEDLVFMNVGLDLQDLVRALATGSGNSNRQLNLGPSQQVTRCSAMVKVVDDDLYSSHVMKMF